MKNCLYCYSSTDTTEKNVSNITLDTLIEYLPQKIRDLDIYFEELQQTQSYDTDVMIEEY